MYNHAMTLEKIFPQPPNKKTRKGILPKIVEILSHREEKETKEREFYNQDKTRKWIFYKWYWDAKQSGQVNAALLMRVGISWSVLMQGMMRWEGDEPPLYAIEVAGIKAGGVEAHYYYESDTGGQKTPAGMWSHAMGIENEEITKLLYSAGLSEEAKLPEYIDFDKTMAQFLHQAKNLDFSTPQLIGKPLIK